MKKLSLLLVALLILVLYHSLQNPAGANQEPGIDPEASGRRVAPAKLKIEIHKIKDSGSSPFWSPDGKEIVYIDKGGLFVISIETPEKNRKIIDGHIKLPRWSPDGKYIAYVDRKGLKIIPPDASVQPRLIYPDNNIQMPVWSPDSKWITFYLSELQGEQGSGIFAVNINTLKSKQLSYTGINPFWSGDGKAVFYFVEENLIPPLPKSTQSPFSNLSLSPPLEKGGKGGFGQLFLARLDGSSVKKLAPIGAGCMNFNSEGDLLAFAPKRKDGTAFGIHIASPFKNDEPIKLSDDGYFPSFSFDSKWVSFFKYDPQIKNTRIYITLLPYQPNTNLQRPSNPPFSPRRIRSKRVFAQSRFDLSAEAKGGRGDFRIKGGELIEIGKGIYPRWAFNKTALVYEMLGVRGGIYIAKIPD